MSAATRRRPRGVGRAAILMILALSAALFPDVTQRAVTDAIELASDVTEPIATAITHRIFDIVTTNTSPTPSTTPPIGKG